MILHEIMHKLDSNKLNVTIYTYGKVGRITGYKITYRVSQKKRYSFCQSGPNRDVIRIWNLEYYGPQIYIRIRIYYILDI